MGGREMPRAAPASGEGDTFSLRAGKTPVSIRLVPTVLQMAPLLPQHALQHRRKLQRQRRVVWDDRPVVSLRFYDVRLGPRIHTKVRRQKFVEVRFLRVLWDLQSTCQLSFVDLTSANSCFTFV
ncbi:hypothetical protein TraAM80_07875 [Trypanosoma rangeli]|uniref:Uncharacterized protein n=1 Tax=Trypanosoma rangeli TaxID=5698 RepID=A0A3R7MCC0_TRYRA|nr:uncharacterized protein TraAM80_07875 [Trypanosoma rangeli]RNE99969.1 hypothetical protein TraAM80_07875 [Trypanosoma rangeli]|eukprot:RNE99969.1 hypothetical protein TraAM80_07875 [Trypanosoma rangeli]